LLLQCARTHWPRVASSVRMATITAQQIISTSLVQNVLSVVTMLKERWCQPLAIHTTRSASHVLDAGRFWWMRNRKLLWNGCKCLDIIEISHCENRLLLFFFFSCFLNEYSSYSSEVQDILWKVDSYSACQRIATFLYGTWRVITIFTKACHWTLSWGSWIQFTLPIPVYLRSILMLSFHLCLGLHSVQFIMPAVQYRS